MLQDNLNWDYFFLDGFRWVDLLEFLSIPHYSNEYDSDQSPLLFEIRTVEYEDAEQLLVIWRPDTPRPTDEQIAAELSSES